MTRLKLSLRNSVKAGLKLLLITLLLSGCTSSTTPSFTKEEIATSIQKICKNEYNFEVKTKLVGETLWIYIPIEGLVEKSEKPEKYIERYSIEHLRGQMLSSILTLEYLIKPLPETEKQQEYKYNKPMIDKINSVWRVLRRVMFSAERKKTTEPKFYAIVVTDIASGFELTDISYYLDIKKVSYEFISMGEFQHRAIQDSYLAPQGIGDKEGLHINYRDITMEEFLTAQIQNRIRMKFQKPEVQKDADINKEIIKVIAYTLKIYDFTNFRAVQLYDLLKNNRIILNQAAVLAKPME